MLFPFCTISILRYLSFEDKYRITEQHYIGKKGDIVPISPTLFDVVKISEVDFVSLPGPATRM